MDRRGISRSARNLTAVRVVFVTYLTVIVLGLAIFIVIGLTHH